MNSSLIIAKQVDVFGQIAMVLIPLAIGTVHHEAMFAILFSLGSWQLLSFLIHLFAGNASWKRYARRTYGATIVGLAALGLFALLSKTFLLFYLVTLAATGIGLGIFYFIISLNEWRELKNSRNGIAG